MTSSVSTEMIFVYVTAPDKEAGRELARAIVDERLAACANILPHMEAIYHWKGSIETAQECVVIFKTRREVFADLEARVKALHSYEVPCIVALPVQAGYAPYLEWLHAETEQKKVST